MRNSSRSRGMALLIIAALLTLIGANGFVANTALAEGSGPVPPIENDCDTLTDTTGTTTTGVPGDVELEELSTWDYLVMTLDALI